MDRNVRIAKELVRIAKEISAANDDQGSFSMPKMPFDLVKNIEAQNWLAENEMCIVCGENDQEKMLLLYDKDMEKCSQFCEQTKKSLDKARKLVDNGIVKCIYSCLDTIACYKKDNGKNGFHMDGMYKLD